MNLTQQQLDTPFFPETITKQRPSSQREIDYLWALFGSFSFFMEEIWRLNKHDPGMIVHWVQKDVAAWLQYGPRKKVTEGFRGLSKTYITCAYIAWRLFRNWTISVLLVSKSEDFCTDSILMIRRWFEDIPFLSHLAPKTKRQGMSRQKSRDKAIKFDIGCRHPSRNPSLAAVGIDGSLPGIRADLIVPDDVETPKNTMTKHLRQQLREIVLELEHILKPGGEIVYLGTPHHEETLYDTLVLERGYSHRTWPLMYPLPDENTPNVSPTLLARLADGTAKPGDFIWPDRCGAAFLAEKGITAHALAMQYQLRRGLGQLERYPLHLEDFIVFPVHRDKAPVSIAWGKSNNRGSLALEDIPSVGHADDMFYGPIMVDEAWKPYHGTKCFCDTAGGGSDEFAWCISSQLHGFIYVKYIDGFSHKPSTEDLERIALSLRDHGATELVFEEQFGGVSYALLMEPILRRLMLRPGSKEAADAGFPDGWGCTVRTEHSAGQKELRIIDHIAPALTTHRIVLDPTVARDTTAMYQLTRITRERGCLEHEDRVEALSGTIALFQEALHQDAQAISKRLQEQQAQELIDKYSRRLGLRNAAPSWINHDHPAPALWS